MIKRFGTAAAILTLGVAGTGLSATQAWASNHSSNHCITVWVEYTEHSGSMRYVHWVESRNNCGAWPGHFQTAGVNGPEGTPPGSHRVNIGRPVVIGSCFSGTAWGRNSQGGYNSVGSTCTKVL